VVEFHSANLGTTRKYFSTKNMRKIFNFKLQGKGSSLSPLSDSHGSVYKHVASTTLKLSRGTR